ncbi:WD40-repeat-containing domain protein [Russula emetica]|nr:WD40-repeat-containing domain protein [Russula emetica]
MSLSWEPIHILVDVSLLSLPSARAADFIYISEFRNPSAPRLASSSKDGTAKVWAIATWRLDYTLGGHIASVNVVRWGGGGLNGKGIPYTASSDRTGKPLHLLKDHAHWVTTLSLNTDFVLRTGPFDHTGKLPSSDEEAQSRALARYNALVSSTSELMITGSNDHTLFLWSLFPSHADSTQPSEVAASKGGKLKPLARLTGLGHQRQVAHVAFSSDGRWAASAAWEDNSVRLWEGRTGKFVATLHGHIGPVYRLMWSADSRLLVSASKDTTLKFRRRTEIEPCKLQTIHYLKKRNYSLQTSHGPFIRDETASAPSHSVDCGSSKWTPKA